jgi:DNA-binding LacI/PurR family transcriptional regulator
MAKQTKEVLVEQIMTYSGVSRSTIFRYFAKKQIRPASFEAITKALEKLTESGQGDNRAKTIVISVSPSIGIFKGNTHALEGILQECSSRSIPIRIDYDRSQDKRNCGVIILGMKYHELDDEIAYLKAQHVSFVVVNRIIDNPDVSYVAVDNRQAMKDLANHLLDQGYQRIALWGETIPGIAVDKRRGYEEAIKERNLQYNPTLFFDSAQIPLEQAIDTAMASKNPPDAWMSMDDETAIRMMKHLSSHGYSVGKDIGVCGYNDIGSAAVVTPSLTSTLIPFREMGKVAAQTLWYLMEHPQVHTSKVIVKHEVHLRESSGHVDS